MKVYVMLEFDSPQDWEQQKWNMYDSIPMLIDWRELNGNREEDD